MAIKDEEKETVYCDGGCGRSVTLRRKKIHAATYYLCNSRVDGEKCKSNLPPLREGMVRVVTMDAAASFWGYTDKWPDIETALSVKRAKELRDIAINNHLLRL